MGTNTDQQKTIRFYVGRISIPWTVLLGVVGLIAHAAVAQYRLTAVESESKELKDRVSQIEQRVFWYKEQN